MDTGLKDKVVLVTGGSKGIGLACARAFLGEGARVAIASREAAHLEAARNELAAAGHALTTVQADLRDAAAAERMVQEVQGALGPVQVLVNSAGAAQRTTPDELTAAHWHAAMDAKYFTSIHAMQAVLPGMRERGNGAIVNVIGIGGKIPSPTHVSGGAANAALMLATAGLANAHARSGVRINAVNPGLVATGRMLEGFAAQARMSGESIDEIRSRQTKAMPMGRLCTPEEIAAVVLFLSSAQASYVNGAMWTVDGAAAPIVF